MEKKEKKPIVKREYSAGGVVYKKENGKICWLLFQPKASEKEPWRKGRWQLPKGWIEPNESSQQTALRETEEEGNVKAEIIEKIDSITVFFYNQEKQKVVKNIVFYLMKWLEDKPDGYGPETEKTLWLPFEEAREKLTFDSEKEILIKAQKILKEEESQPRLI